MVGGAPVSEKFATDIGADGWGPRMRPSAVERARGNFWAAVTEPARTNFYET